jgi:hypothetical protein
MKERRWDGRWRERRSKTDGIGTKQKVKGEYVVWKVEFERKQRILGMKRRRKLNLMIKERRIWESRQKKLLIRILPNLLSTPLHAWHPCTRFLLHIPWFHTHHTLSISLPHLLLNQHNRRLSSGLENRYYRRRGSEALTIRHPSIRKSWH